MQRDARTPHSRANSRVFQLHKFCVPSRMCSAHTHFTHTAPFVYRACTLCECVCEWLSFIWFYFSYHQPARHARARSRRSTRRSIKTRTRQRGTVFVQPLTERDRTLRARSPRICESSLFTSRVCSCACVCVCVLRVYVLFDAPQRLPFTRHPPENSVCRVPIAQTICGLAIACAGQIDAVRRELTSS